MAAMMSSLVISQTVNLTHLAVQLFGKAIPKSKYRRLQHFFKKVHFGQPAVAGFTMRLLNQKGPKHLALDRTNWKLGKPTSICAPFCGGETAVDMENFGKIKEKFLRQFLEFPHGIPCHDA